MAPQLIFGTASFGMDMTEFQDAESVQELLGTLKELGISRLDSAARYPPMNPGRSEELIGEAQKLSSGFQIDTKVYTDTQTDGSGDLSVEAVEKSVGDSLKRLQKSGGIHILHAHRGDPSTPLEEQILAFNEQITRGHCTAWGVSNMSIETLQEILKLCEKNGWRKPTCYQGSYNILTRGMEAELLPLLRANGMSFNAFQALAAGFLTGKAVNNEQGGTRFADNNPLGKVMQKVFGAEGLRDAMKRFDAGVKAQGLTPIEVAIRWIAYHSALGDGDGIILGASRTNQIRDTVALIRRGSLPENVLALVEQIWEDVKGTRGHLV